MKPRTSPVLGSLFDSSAWIALLMPAHPSHADVLTIANSATSSEPLVFCRSSQQSLLRLLTTSHVMKAYDAAALSNREALATYDVLCSRPHVVEHEESPGTFALWRRLAASDSASPRVWMDAYLAAFAMTSDLRLVAADKDFRKYQSEGLNFHLLR